MQMMILALLATNVVLLGIIALSLSKLAKAFTLSAVGPRWADNDGVMTEFPRSHDAKTVADKIEFIACAIRVMNEYKQRSERK